MKPPRIGVSHTELVYHLYMLAPCRTSNPNPPVAAAAVAYRMRNPRIP